MTDPAIEGRLQYLHDQDDYGGPQLHAAIRAVLEIHTPRGDTNVKGEPMRHANGSLYVSCAHCASGNPYVSISNDWPCPTVAALTEALNRWE